MGIAFSTEDAVGGIASSPDDGGDTALEDLLGKHSVLEDEDGSALEDEDGPLRICANDLSCDFNAW